MAFDERLRGRADWIGRRDPGGFTRWAMPGIVLGVLTALVLPLPVALGGARGKGAGGRAVPRYRFEAGRQYVYEIRIEANTPDGKQTTSGHSYYTVKSVDAESGNMTLSHWGALSTRRVGSFRPRIPFRPPPFAFSDTNYRLKREIVIDPTGRVIKSRGHAYLPALLGDLWQLVLDPMPPEGKRAWKSSNEVVLLKRDTGFPWRVPLRAGMAVSRTARETAKYTLGKADAGVVTIEKEYELATEEKADDKPFLKQVGEGQIAFDVAGGVLKTLQMDYTITIQRDKSVLKIPVSVSARLLEEAEAEKLAEKLAEQREAAVAGAPAAAKPKALDDAALDAALADLKTGNRSKMLAAANRLAGAVPVQQRRREVAKALEPLLESPESFVPGAAAKALAVWGTKKNVPALIAVLEGGNIFRKMAAISALAKLKDKRGAEAVAQQVVPLPTRAAATNALKEMGPIAASAVVPLVEHEDWAVQVAACRLLGEIGTPKSVAALEQAQKASNPAVAAEAKKALEAIGKRRPEPE